MGKLIETIVVCFAVATLTLTIGLGGILLVMWAINTL